MLKTLSAALVAASLIAGPVLAQGTGNTPASAGQAAKTQASTPAAGKTAVKPVKKTKKHAVKSSKHRKVMKHATAAKHKKIVKRAPPADKSAPRAN